MKIKQIRDIFPDIQVARFNLAAWQISGSDSLGFIGREVKTPGEKGEPDTGILKLFEVEDHGGEILLLLVWTTFNQSIQTIA